VNGTIVTDVDAFKKETSAAKQDGVARLRVRRGSGFFLAFLRLK
jgi:hypothetical protein